MKKITLSFAVLFISAVTINSVNAQTEKNNVGIADTKYMQISLPFGDATFINSSSENLNTINTKAARDFYKNYKVATDEKWYKVSNGYFARFSSNNNENMVAY